MRRWAGTAAALVLLAGVSGCGGDDSSGGGHGDTTLTVYAAASLTSTFEQIGTEFEKEHDGVKVEFEDGSAAERTYTPNWGRSRKPDRQQGRRRVTAAR